jgi:unspecific monooxygenase
MMKTLPDGPKTPKLLQQLHWLVDPMSYLEGVAQKPYRDFFKPEPLGLGPSPLFISHPKALQQIFTDTKSFTAPGDLNQIFRPFIGDYALVCLSGKSHRRQRQLLTPPLHGERMAVYGELICNHASMAFEQLKMDQTFLAHTTMQEIAQKVILKVLFGIRQEEQTERLRKCVKNLSDIFNHPLNYIWMFFPLLQRDLGPLTSWGHFYREREKVDEIIYGEIRERRSSPDSTRTDILSLLMGARDEEGQPMSDVEIRDQLMNLLIAGNETSATGMSLALYWIHHMPEVTEKLLAELDTLEGNFDPAKIVKLPYLSAVCNEVLRINPIAITLMPRLVQEEVELLGYSLPPGTLLIPCAYLTHQREDLYPEPKKFKPERFLERKYYNYEFLGFGGGSRRCVGNAFAMYEMKLVLATILSKYKLELVEHKPIKLQRRGLNITPVGGVKMVIKGQRSRKETPVAATV